MIVKTPNLSHDALDFVVATIEKTLPASFDDWTQTWPRYSSDPARFVKLLAKHVRQLTDIADECWEAKSVEGNIGTGSDPMIATARCYVADHFVYLDVPDEIFINSLSKVFLYTLKNRISKQDFEAACQRNAVQQQPNICHSHDFCDANMVMAQAFEAASGIKVDIENDNQRYIWTSAWRLATGAMSMKGHRQISKEVPADTPF